MSINKSKTMIYIKNLVEFAIFGPFYDINGSII